MDILESYTIENADYGYTDDTVIYCARVKIFSVSTHAKEMIDAISNTSWLNSLGMLIQASCIIEFLLSRRNAERNYLGE